MRPQRLRHADRRARLIELLDATVEAIASRADGSSHDETSGSTAPSLPIPTSVFS